MTIGALFSVWLHRFVMSGLRSEIMNDTLDEFGEHKKCACLFLFVLVALAWPIFVIKLIARR